MMMSRSTGPLTGLYRPVLLFTFVTKMSDRTDKPCFLGNSRKWAPDQRDGRPSPSWGIPSSNQPFEAFIFIKAKVRPSRDRVGALPGGACIRPARRPSEGIVKRDVVRTSFHSRESSIAFSFRLLD